MCNREVNVKSIRFLNNCDPFVYKKEAIFKTKIAVLGRDREQSYPSDKSFYLLVGRFFQTASVNRRRAERKRESLGKRLLNRSPKSQQ
ncbi:AAEL004871-PA [Aedes aegypti]|uniref:AAEL004871-PA n=1 Tax=Aedes aegypti TaxID=7159 RepID=Q17BQ7_AEDAE|nr:AAEL004871-PA [Aedes aegypti]